jgi:radical SAM protein with 4Fe4S-binding SPASM domain
MEEARALGATTLSLSGGDPILLGPLAIDYIEHALDLGFSEVLFYSTGIWDIDYSVVDGKVINTDSRYFDCYHQGIRGLRSWGYVRSMRDLAPRGLTFIFSLHSHRPVVNDYIMNVAGAWQAIIEGIRTAVAYGIRVNVHFVPMLPNYAHLSAVRDLCEGLGVSKMSVLRFVPQTRGYVHRSVLNLSPLEFSKLQDIMDYEATDPARKEMQCALRFGCPVDFRHAAVGTSQNLAKLGKAKACHAGQDLILVRPDGTVHPCAAWKSLTADSNVREHSLEWIWENSQVFNAIRQFTAVDYENIEGRCANCVWLNTCKGGCPAQKLHAHEKSLQDIYHPTPDPLCPRMIKPTDKKLQNQGEAE